MKIVLTRSMVESDIQYIKRGLDREIADKYEIVIPDEFSEEGICNVARDADMLLGPFISKKILASIDNLKLIQVPWTGMDTFDFEAVKGTNVPVCNTHSNADSVAELGITLVLDLLKKVSYHDRKMRAGNWNRDQKPLNLKSKMLSEQTVCILGFGHIGSRIGKLISAFGTKVIAVSSHAKVGDVLSEVYSSADMKKALNIADIVICSLPLTDNTRNLINKEMIDSMKDGAMLVNLSRAAVIDEDAIWEALESEKISAFGSDVWWNPPKRGESQSYPSAKYEFWKKDNVIMSPHRAGFVEDKLPHLDGAIENIIALEKGNNLSGIVDIRKGF